MFDWLKRRNTSEGMPEYAAVRRTPSRGLPSDLSEAEASPEFSAQRKAIEGWLREPPRLPQADQPLFVELVAADQSGVLTMTLPEDGSHCLPIFSSPYRASDYIRTLLSTGPSAQYLSSTPLELVGMLRDLRRFGIEQFALDRCPRCSTFASIGSESVTTAEDIINCWSIWKATELARLELYLNYARASARSGKLDVAREVLFETVAHVSLEDPRPHLLLGQVAVALHDKKLVREAKTFLQFFQLGSWERQLDEDIRSSSPNFEFAE